jgi:hypothetical protein
MFFPDLIEDICKMGGGIWKTRSSEAVSTKVMSSGVLHWVFGVVMSETEPGPVATKAMTSARP